MKKLEGWTLFLDRDGVINRKRDGDYVKTWSDFEFLPGVLETLPKLYGIFDRMIVVTNQQGIGKGYFTRDALAEVHQKMCEAITKQGADICQIYFAPQLDEEKHPDRKPGTGMGLRAKADFPDIEFEKSVIVGDSPTDMEFGRSLGLKTIMVGPKHSDLADQHFKSLAHFGEWLIDHLQNEINPLA